MRRRSIHVHVQNEENSSTARDERAHQQRPEPVRDRCRDITCRRRPQEAHGIYTGTREIVHSSRCRARHGARTHAGLVVGRSAHLALLSPRICYAAGGRGFCARACSKPASFDGRANRMMGERKVHARVSRCMLAYLKRMSMWQRLKRPTERREAPWTGPTRLR